MGLENVFGGNHLEIYLIEDIQMPDIRVGFY